MKIAVINPYDTISYIINGGKTHIYAFPPFPDLAPLLYMHVHI